MSKNPVLGVVPCTVSDCGGQMRVRQSNRGRGGHIRLYGHCDECKRLAQSKDDQEHLSRYLENDIETGVTQPEAAPVAVSAVETGEDWNPAKNPPETLPETPSRKEPKARSGGVWRFFVGVTAVAAVALGAGALAAR